MGDGNKVDNNYNAAMPADNSVWGAAWQLFEAAYAALLYLAASADRGGIECPRTLQAANLAAGGTLPDARETGAEAWKRLRWSSAEGRPWRDARRPDPDRFLNQDGAGRMHFPGFSLEAAEYFVAERSVAGLGIDTHGVDGGLDASCAVSRRALERPRAVLENLANLGRLPPRGAMVFVGALPIVGGAGSPAAVLAINP